MTWRNSMYSSEWNLVMSGMLAMYGRNTWTRVSQGRARMATRRQMASLADLHLLVEVVVEDERVGDAQPVGLHGVQLAVVEVPHLQGQGSCRAPYERYCKSALKPPDLWVVEVGHLGPGVGGDAHPSTLEHGVD